jgi:hypothetical protein
MITEKEMLNQGVSGFTLGGWFANIKRLNVHEKETGVWLSLLFDSGQPVGP